MKGRSQVRKGDTKPKPLPPLPHQQVSRLAFQWLTQSVQYVEAHPTRLAVLDPREVSLVDAGLGGQLGLSQSSGLPGISQSDLHGCHALILWLEPHVDNVGSYPI